MFMEAVTKQKWRRLRPRGVRIAAPPGAKTAEYVLPFLGVEQGSPFLSVTSILGTLPGDSALRPCPLIRNPAGAPASQR
jgi:hypothetical protein